MGWNEEMGIEPGPAYSSLHLADVQVAHDPVLQQPNNHSAHVVAFNKLGIEMGVHVASLPAEGLDHCHRHCMCPLFIVQFLQSVSGDGERLWGGEILYLYFLEIVCRLFLSVLLMFLTQELVEESGDWKLRRRVAIVEVVDDAVEAVDHFQFVADPPVLYVPVNPFD